MEPIYRRPSSPPTPESVPRTPLQFGFVAIHLLNGALAAPIAVRLIGDQPVRIPPEPLEGLAKVVEWSRTLPCRARETREILSVGARLAVKEGNEARRYVGGLPSHRARPEVRARIEWGAPVREVIHANARNHRVDLAVLGELKGGLDRLVGREAVCCVPLQTCTTT